MSFKKVIVRVVSVVDALITLTDTSKITLNVIRPQRIMTYLTSTSPLKKKAHTRMIIPKMTSSNNSLDLREREEQTFQP